MLIFRECCLLGLSYATSGMVRLNGWQIANNIVMYVESYIDKEKQSGDCLSTY